MFEGFEVKKILVLEDEPIAQMGLRLLLSRLGRERGWEIVGICSTIATAREQWLATRPDLTLVDIELPDGDGLEFVKELMARSAQSRILVFSILDSQEKVLAALQAGVRAYCTKSLDVDLLSRAIEAALLGECFLDPMVAGYLVDRVRSRGFHVRQQARSSLTERERQILSLISSGLKNPEIAQILYVSVSTVKSHVSHILSKLTCRDRAAAVAVAFQEQLI
ncbi:MAG: response regulator transcription factor [Cyanobacteriota bacterium]|nr:response regulator transcription factor [Cyanobacteriota bacterium]